MKWSMRVPLFPGKHINQSEELVTGKNYGIWRLIMSGDVNVWTLNTQFEMSYALGSHRNASWASLKRLNADLTYYFRSPARNRVGIFGNLYYGQDYYNISYEQTLKVARLGVMMTSITDVF